MRKTCMINHTGEHVSICKTRDLWRVKLLSGTAGLPFTLETDCRTILKVSRNQDGLRCARMSFQMGQRTTSGLMSMEQTSYPEVLIPKHYSVNSSFVVPETVLKLLESFLRYFSNGCGCMQVRCGIVSFHIDSNKLYWVSLRSK